MGPSDKYDAEAIRKMRATAASAAAQMPQYKIDPHTISAMNSMVNAVRPLESFRNDMLKQMSPILESMNQMNNYKMDLVTPELAKTIDRLAEFDSIKQQFASPPWMQELRETMKGFEPVVTPELTNMMRDVLGTSVTTEQFARNVFSTPAITETIQSINVMNGQAGLFAETFTKSMAPVMESLRATFEQSKIFDDFDFSVLDDVDEGAFEDFLDEHPELEEAYESIEEQLVSQGLISEETLTKTGSRFKSSRIAKHLMIAVIMFSAGAAIMFGVKTLPDNLEDDAYLYLGIVGFMYTAYSVHSMVKNAITPPPASST
ncbi:MULTISPECIES: hypothetical protein [Rhodococcus]|uniref:hypothetical protein n=1 Tax=Rhodococcus TaxID=1827 RepID=UPI001E44EC55|nr:MULTISPECIES: hypothetical protein [Rhodococcus]UEL35413.1 hypothetical protein KTR60_12110 [Rhodococcus sp. C1]UXF69708.1 hypothetical protein N6G92_11975 [Rhodococcus qingshengii]